MKEIKVSIITIGDELLIGQTIDTNSSWMAQQLNREGFWVRKRIAVADDAEEIIQTLSEESQLSDVVLITGGLGPTEDDKTKAVLCTYFETDLILNQEVLEQVKKRVSQYDHSLLERNKNQALVPDKAEILFNERGTAPGLWFEKKDTVYVAMPGIPFEMKGLMEKMVLPKLIDRFTLSAILHHTWQVTGVPESVLADELETFERSLPPQIQLAYLPSNGILKLRLTAKGDQKQKMANKLDQYGTSLKNKIRKYLLVEGDSTVSEWVGEKLRKNKWSVSTAESCTGGYIGHLLTSIPGSSDYFKGALVTYSNEMKQRLLGISEKVLLEKGAVSEEVVKEMLLGVIRQTKTDVAIAVSGIMGPGGGTKEKPVGAVWIAAGNRDEIKTRKLNLRYNREKNIELTASYALILLLDVLKDIGK